MANTKDTVEERVFDKQNKEEQLVNSLLWLRSNPEDPKSTELTKKLGLRPVDVQALQYTAQVEDEDEAEAVFGKIVKNVQRNQAANQTLQPSMEELEKREQKIETTGKAVDVKQDMEKKAPSPLSPEVEKSLQETGPLGPIMASVIKGVSLGKADEIIGFGKAIQQKFINQDPRDFEEIFAEESKKVQAVFGKVQEQAPVTSEIVETGASFASPVTRIAGAVVGKAGKIAKLAAETAVVSGAEKAEEGGEFVEGAKEGLIAGAGTGLIFKGAGKVVKGVAKGIEKLSSSAVFKAVGAESKSAISKLQKEITRRGLDVNKFGEELAKIKTPKGKPVVAAGDTIVNTAIKSREALDAAGQKIGDLLSQAEGVGVKSKTVVKRLVKDVINPLLKSGNSDDRAIAKKLSTNIKDFFTKFGKDKQVSVKDLQTWRQRFSENISADSTKAANKAAQKFDKVYRKAIDIVMAKAEKAGKIPAGFKQAKNEYKVISSFIDMNKAAAEAEKLTGAAKSIEKLISLKRGLIVGAIAAPTAGIGPALALGAGIEIASRRAASTIVSLTKRGVINKVAKGIQANIGSAGKFRPILEQAIKMGPKAVVGAHIAISDLNDKYRKDMSGAANIQAERKFKGRK